MTGPSAITNPRIVVVVSPACGVIAAALLADTSPAASQYSFGVIVVGTPEATVAPTRSASSFAESGKARVPASA